MENSQTEDLTTRTANLKRQLLEKMQHRESTPLSRTTSVPPPSTSGATGAADIKPPAPSAQPPPAAQATSQLRLKASETDLNDLIIGISSASAIAPGAPARVPNSAETAPMTATPADHRVAPAHLQGAHQRTASFHRPRESPQNHPAPLLPEQARPLIHGARPIADQYAISGSWMGHLQEATLPPSERNGHSRDNGSPGSTNRPSGMFEIPVPSAAQNGPYKAPFPSVPAGIDSARPGRVLTSLGADLRLRPDELRDVSDWLVHTHFYDVGYRQKFLSRRRRLAELEEERLKLLQEVEEESSRYGRIPFPVGPGGGYIAAGSQVNSPAMGPPSNPVYAQEFSPPIPPLLPAYAHQPVVRSPAVTRPATPEPMKVSLGEIAHPERLGMLQQGDGHRHGSKRAWQENDNPATQREQLERPSKLARTKDEARKPEVLQREAKTQSSTSVPPPAATIATEMARETPHSSSGHDSAAHGAAERSAPVSSAAIARPSSRDAGFNPPSGPSPRLSQRNRYTPSDDKIKDEHDEADPSWKVPHHDTYKATNTRPTTHTGPIDLGQKGDTKFYLIKPVSDKLVDDAMEDNLWSTSQSNGDILRNRFRSHRNVILFFSVNKSRSFQGYARMTSEPSPSIPRPKWMARGKVITSPPFKIEWLNTYTMSNHYAHSIKNSLNDGLPVTVGLDGQEIEDAGGRALIQSMEINRYKQTTKDSPKSKPSSNYISRSSGSTKKSRPAERTWGTLHYSNQSEQGHNRPYSPSHGSDRDRR
ncbi:YTH domain-containing protein [Ophiostoma piceae UAMH 11346]|uniref:YTH domain-containing protein n=1 Tax=Ophiostoma piceae (strain UAMH 11346) TaxID=1262450 RepID=S3CNK2_OPHP1|nr:YTH domain-containing protein [Ophiostoma piceae UAMH 11346]